MEFDGQQSGEKVFTVIRPHISHFYISFTITIVCFIIVLAILLSITSYIPAVAYTVNMIGAGASILILIIASWWLWKTQSEDKTYITDRRIIRFDVVTPFFTNKRALFWNEILKVKAYAPNMIMRLLKVGTLQIEPVAAEAESIVIPDVYYHEDLANYLDKILFTFKNTPSGMFTIKPFVAKPKGKRD